MADRKKYVTVQLEPPARAALQRASLAAGAQVGRRASMSAVLVAALEVAAAHSDELAAALDRALDGEGD